jgi:uncharacterized protein (DUF2225 family)
MTTTETHRFTCPLCGNMFDSQLITSTNSFGPLHSDFYREASGMQPICLFVHTCPNCGYTGFEGDFGQQSFSPEFTRLVAEVITPEVKAITLDGKRKIDTNGNYYLAALCAQWRGASALELGRIYHMGAWCFRVRGDKDKENFFLARAAEQFEKALAAGQPPKDMYAMYAYIIGDIYRRLGEAGRAKEWYGKAGEMLKAYGGEKQIGEYAERQMKEPKDIF